MYNPKRLRQLSWILLGMSFSYAILAYVLSSFLETILSDSQIGLVFTVGYLLAFWVTYKLAHFIHRFGKYHTAAVLFLLNVAPLIWLSIFPQGALAIVAVLIYIVSQVSLLVVVDVYVQNSSAEQMTGAIRGGQLTYMNLGILLGPLVAGFILTGQPFTKLFLVSATIGFIITIFFLTHFTDDAEHIIKVHEPKWWLILGDLTKHRHLGPIFIASFLLNFFYSWMVIYTPLYLRHLQFSWQEIGHILFVALIPFVLIQYFIGWLIDKTTTEKSLLVFSFIIIATATIMLAFLPTQFWWWAIVLFISRIGAATLEVTADAAFFRRVLPSDINLIDFYRLSRPLAYILGPALGGLLLSFMPLNSLFIILGVIMLSGLYISARLPSKL